MSQEVGVIIARFQPFHDGYLQLVREALRTCERLVLVLGSHNSSRSVRNPFTSLERHQMIQASLTPEENSRVNFVAVRDCFYQPELWVNEVREKVKHAAGGEKPVRLFGCAEGAAVYLTWFKDWPLLETQRELEQQAAFIRDTYFRDAGALDTLEAVPLPVRTWLKQFRQTDAYFNLATERRTIDEYKKSWSLAPFSPIFVTTDAMIVQAGHILLIRSGRAPGKGLLALPGGFLDADEPLTDGVLRELEEETQLSVSRSELREALVGTTVFDHPRRSARGRTITHAYCFKLKGDRLATVKAADDAADALWLPLSDLPKMEDQMFEDHFHIINSFMRGGVEL